MFDCGEIASTNPHTCHPDPDPELAKGKRKDPQLHFHALRVAQDAMFDCGEMAQPTRIPVILTLTLSLRRGSGRIRGCIFMVSGETTFHV
jgi:hypothetical protein